LEAILWHAGWEVRILTKNAAVTKDFDLVAKYRDRVVVGLSLTGTARQEEILKVLETNASPITDRMAAIRSAHRLGLRTYGMLCPLLPGIADDPKTVDELVQFCLDNGAEEIFAEAVNPRGNSLRLCAKALQEAGFEKEAAAVDAVRTEKNWSRYVARLVKTVQDAMKNHGGLDKLRFLLYTAGLQDSDLKSIRKDDAGIKWLGK
jgi:DNA repair photolyase